MLKSSILNVKSYKTYIKYFLRSYWYFFFLGFSVMLFLIFIFFKTEMAVSIMDLRPPLPGRGLAFYTDLVWLIATEMLWIAMFFFLCTAMVMYTSEVSLGTFFDLKTTFKTGSYAAIVCMLFFIATLLTAFHTLESFPNSSDEQVYIFQAGLLSEGKLWERSHSLPDFFYFNNIVQQDGILVGRYPPGWPLFLSVAIGTGVPLALVNPVLGVTTLIVFYFFARRLYGDTVGLWSLVCVAFTGYFIFSSASFFSHVLSLLMTILFVSNIYLYQQRKHEIYGLLAGFCLGIIAITQYYTAAMILFPFLVCIVYQYRVKSLYLFAQMAIGSVPCIAYLLWYNYSITGDPFLPVAEWAASLQEKEFVKEHTFVEGLANLFKQGFVFFYWISPGLLILYLLLIWRKIRSASARFIHAEDYIFISLALGYFFSFQVGENQYGPRMLFEGFAFLVLFIVRQIVQLREKWTVAFLLVSVLFAVAKFPFITSREARIVDQRQDLFNLVKDYEISNAIVFVTSGTSPIRPMPPADLTRNTSMFQSEVIYALDISNISDQLRKYYSDRSFYRYTREPDEPHGKLVEIK